MMIKFSIWLFPSCHLLSPTPSEPRVRLPLLYIPIAMLFALSFLPIMPPSPPISNSRSADDDKIFRNSISIQTLDIFVVLRADTVCGEEGKSEDEKVKLTKLKVIFWRKKDLNVFCVRPSFFWNLKFYPQKNILFFIKFLRVRFSPKMWRR